MGQMLFEIPDCNGHRLHLGFCRRSLDSFQVVGWECGGRGLAGGWSDGVSAVANGAKKHFSGGILYIQWTSWKFWYPKRISSSNAQFLAFIIYVCSCWTWHKPIATLKTRALPLRSLKPAWHLPGSHPRRKISLPTRVFQGLCFREGIIFCIFTLKLSNHIKHAHIYINEYVWLYVLVWLCIYIYICIYAYFYFWGRFSPRSFLCWKWCGCQAFVDGCLRLRGTASGEDEPEREMTLPKLS